MLETMSSVCPLLLL